MAQNAPLSAPPIEGVEAMCERLAAEGHSFSVEDTGGGVQTIYVYFADGFGVSCGDALEPGKWAYSVETVADGESVAKGERLRGETLVRLIASESTHHGGPLDMEAERRRTYGYGPGE